MYFMINYILLRNNSGLDLLFGIVILFVLYIIFSNITIIIKSIFKLISKITIGVLGSLAILITYMFIGFDFMFALFFFGGFWFFIAASITKNEQLIWLIGITWYSTLIFLRYYFGIKFLKFKFFQFISENLFGLRREDLFDSMKD